MIYTTREELKKYNVCKSSFEKLISAIPNYDNAVKISILQIIELNGIADAIWSLRAIIGKKKKEKISIEFAIACAGHVLSLYKLKHPDDNRPGHAIETAKTVLKSNTKKHRAAAYAAADAANAAAADAAAYTTAYATAAAYAAADVAYTAAAYAAVADATTVVAYAYAAAAAYAAVADATDVYVNNRADHERKWQKQKLIEILEKYEVSPSQKQTC